MPMGVMYWPARAATKCLASHYNLAIWKKIVDPKRPLCSILPCTVGHLFSNCTLQLWKHDKIVK